MCHKTEQKDGVYKQGYIRHGRRKLSIKPISFNVTVLFRVLKCEYVHQDLLPSFLSCLCGSLRTLESVTGY